MGQLPAAPDATPKASDHHVGFRREEWLAEQARRCRIENGEPYGFFSLIRFVRNVLPSLVPGGFTIELFDAKEGDDPAYVTFSPKRVLHVDREIWDLADRGEPQARYIVAHEAGHLLLHDVSAKAFSGHRLSFDQKETSAEWQADTFADYLLVDDRTAASGLSRSEIGRICAAPADAVERRTIVIKPADRPALTGDFCTSCGGFLVRRNGVSVGCNSCSKEFAS